MSLKGCVKSIIGGCVTLVLFCVLAGIAFAWLLDKLQLISEGEVYIIDEKVVTESQNTLPAYESEFEWESTTGFFNTSYYKLKFVLPKKDVEDAMAYLSRLGKMTYEDVGIDESIYYTDSLQFYCEYWRIVYGNLINHDAPVIDKIKQSLYGTMAKHNMKGEEAVKFLVSFVQNIDYRIPETPLGVLPPLPILKEKYADCDSKALLLYMLLEGMNINCVIFYSPYYQHAMLGVDYAGLSQRKFSGGTYYYFLETTYPGWEIGQLPPEMENKELWFILDLKV